MYSKPANSADGGCVHTCLPVHTLPCPQYVSVSVKQISLEYTWCCLFRCCKQHLCSNHITVYQCILHLQSAQACQLT